MEVRLCAQCGRWLHAFGPRRRDLRRNRRGATPPLCRDDPGQGRSAFDGTAAFLHARPKCARRSPCLCITDALHSGSIARSVRKDNLAPAGGRIGGPFCTAGAAYRCRCPHARHVALRRSKLCFKTTLPEVLPLISRQRDLDTTFLFCSNRAWIIELMKFVAKSAL